MGKVRDDRSEAHAKQARVLVVRRHCQSDPRRSAVVMRQWLMERREEILRIAGSHGATQVRVFGSVARGEDDTQSDVDFLVSLAPGRSLFDLGGIQYELEALLDRKVDVVTERGLKRRIRERVLRESVIL